MEAGIGFIVAVIGLGLVFNLPSLFAPQWTGVQLAQSSPLSTLIVQNLGKLAWLLAPGELKESLNQLFTPILGQTE